MTSNYVKKIQFSRAQIYLENNYAPNEIKEPPYAIIDFCT